MSEMLSVVGKSIAEEKGKHAAGLATTGGGATVASANQVPIPTGDLWTDTILFLPYMATAAGMCLSLFLFYKAYRELKLVEIRIQNERSRRNDDMD